MAAATRRWCRPTCSSGPGRRAGPSRPGRTTPAVVNVIAFARALQLAKDAAAPGGDAALPPVRDAASPPGEDAVDEPAVAQRSARDILRQDRLDGYCGPQLLAELRKTLIGHTIEQAVIEATALAQPLGPLGYLIGFAITADQLRNTAVMIIRRRAGL